MYGPHKFYELTKMVNWYTIFQFIVRRNRPLNHQCRPEFSGRSVETTFLNLLIRRELWPGHRFHHLGIKST